jgi:hypothetical protein
MVLLTVVAGLLEGNGTVLDDTGSTYASGPRGAKAAFLLLRRLGYDAVRSYEPITAIRDTPSSITLVLASPFLPPSEGDRAALRRFVAAGGVVIATGLRGARFLPDVTSVPMVVDEVEEDEPEPRGYKPAMASALARRAPSIELLASPVEPVFGSRYTVVYASGDARGVMTARFGSGRVIWWAGTDPVKNRTITAAHHVQFLLNVMGAPAERRILWDEHYHGYHRSFLSYVARTPLPAAFAHAALIAVAAIVTLSVNRLPLRSLPETPRLAPLEFIDAMGSLYGNARASTVAVDVARSRLRRLLVTMTGVSANTDDARLAETAQQRFAIEPATIRAFLETSDVSTRTDLTHRAALPLVQRFQDAARRLQTFQTK